MGPPHGTVARYECQALGTGCVLAVDLPGAGETVAAMDAFIHIMREELDRVDHLASRFRPGTEIVDLNHDPRSVVPVSEGLFGLLDAALWAAEVTHGSTDPTVADALAAAGYDRDFAEVPASRDGALTPIAVPGWRSVRLDRHARTVSRTPGVHLDLGATAKAVTADRIAAAVAAASGRGVLVSLGGDVAVSGPAPVGGWSVGLADRWWEESALAVAVHDGGVASSSTTARHWRVGGQPAHHLVDPRTGLPVHSPWRTATVVAASCLQANAASTAAIVKGSAALTWLESLGLPARLVDTHGRVLVTSAWPVPPVAPAPPATPTPGRVLDPSPTRMHQ